MTLDGGTPSGLQPDPSPHTAKLLSTMIAGRDAIHMEEPEFWARFGAIEHETLEFKTSYARLREIIPAMAMTAGGQIILGVTDDRRLRGCRLDQDVLDAIMRQAQQSEVDVHVRPMLVSGIALILVVVPCVRDRIVTTSDGRLLRRVGSDNLPVRGDEVARFVRRRLGPVRLLRRLTTTTG